jgi:uncharacterized membrane protein
MIMAEQEQKVKHEADKKCFRHPRRGEPGYDEFMRELFRKAASNMLRGDNP